MLPPLFLKRLGLTYLIVISVFVNKHSFVHALKYYQPVCENSSENYFEASRSNGRFTRRNSDMAD